MTNALHGNVIAGCGMQLAIRNLAAAALLIIFSTSTFAGRPGNGDPDHTGLDYQIATWYKFKDAAFSISFDDNYRSQVTWARPILNQYNYKATYFIVTNRVGKGWAPGWDTLNMLAAEGHEIASHSKNHANFSLLEQDPLMADSMMHEFRDSRDTLNQRIPNQRCETFAWPGGNVGWYSCEMSKKYYMACRGSNNNFEFSDPINFFNLSSQHIYHETPLETVNGFVDTVLAKKGWLIERWHGFRIKNDTNGYEPVAVDLFSEHFKHVGWNGDNLWVAPVGTVAKYMLERDASKLTLADSSASMIFLNLTNDLPDSLIEYNFPVSIKVRAFGKVANTQLLTQNKDTLAFSITTEENRSFLYFNAVPNHGQICLHLSNEASGTADNRDVKKNAYNYPNPFPKSTTIFFDVLSDETAVFRVFDQTGRLVRTFAISCHSGRNTASFDGNGLSPGIYTCNIKTREGILKLRMLLSD